MTMETVFGDVLDRAQMDRIQHSIEESVDRRLFLSLEYAPKAYAGRDPELAFWYAVTNAYGWCKDCAPYLRRGAELVRALQEADALSKEDAGKMFRQIDLVCAWRGFFCHNSLPSSWGTKKSRAICREFLSDVLSVGWNGEIDIPLQLALKKKDWHDVFDVFCACVKEILDILESSIQKLVQTPKQAKDAVVEAWITGLANWYGKGSFLYPAVYREYHEDDMAGCGRPRLNARLERLIIDQILQKHKEEWCQRYKDAIRAMDSPAYPDPVSRKIVADDVRREKRMRFGRGAP